MNNLFPFTELIYIISQRMEGSINGQLIYLINVCFIFKKILKMCAHSKISMVIRGGSRISS